MRQRWFVSASVAIALSLAIGAARPRETPASELPAKLSDQEFWQLVTDSSEPGGYFRNENITNLTSNELWYQYVIPDLVARTPRGGVYLGVGPEQNYTYMAAVRPRMAVIFDIRRGNLDIQLMYKAIFELSRDRADFVSMLFSKPRPAGVGPKSTAAELFGAFGSQQTSQALYKQNVAAIRAYLTKTRALPIPADDLAAIETIYQTFFWSGFAVRSSPTYADLMMATDSAGISRSYLATEESFAFLKDLQARNLVVPVVGDFGGTKAIRAIARYLKAQGGVVTAFYLSNVEQYLYQDGKIDVFCRNVAALPLDPASTFIRSSSGGGGFSRGGGFVSSLGSMQGETKTCGF